MDIRVNNTINRVSKRYSISVEDIKGKSREKGVCFARAHCYYILKNQFKFNYSEIAASFGRNHATVMNALHRYSHELGASRLIVSPRVSTEEKTKEIHISNPKLLHELLIKERDLIYERLECVEELIELYNRKIDSLKKSNI